MSRPTAAARAPVLTVNGVSKSYGAQRALHQVSLTVAAGELLGLAGHNGAGKSTLFNVVTGYTSPDSGSVEFPRGGDGRKAKSSSARARRAGVSIVRQELALCPALTVAESAGILARGGGPGWKRSAWRRLETILGEMFPGHRLRASDTVAGLGVSARQMLECAGAVLSGGRDLSVLILDEPTSSLDRDAAGSLYAWLRARAADGLAAIVTTHRLREMTANLDRVVVLRDGRVVGEADTRDDGAAETVMRSMGTEESRTARSGVSDVVAGERERGGICLRIADRGGSAREVRGGEIVGLGGLEGHGQREVLRAAFDAARRGSARTRSQLVETTASSAYVSGDRAQAGIFRFWTVAKNLSIASLAANTRLGFISGPAEDALTAAWLERLGIKAAAADSITSLSGGTQQKVLIARALATGSRVLLLEDPFRGVDQATKEEAYRMIREQAAEGKCVIWYSTEIEEYQQCDRLLVFREGRIVREIQADDIDDRQAIISASFAEPENEGSVS